MNGMNREMRKYLIQERQAQKIVGIIEELKGNITIVEGKKDKFALKALGLSNIVAINGRPLIQVVQKLYKEQKHTKNKKMVILTDFDKKGREIAAKLKHLLQRYKIPVSSRLRNKMMKFGKNKIEDFRNLNRGDNHGKISANFNKVHNKSSYKSKRCYREARCYWSYIWPNRGLIRFWFGFKGTAENW